MPILHAHACSVFATMQAHAQQAESVDVMNEWAENVTKGLIKTAVPPDADFDVVLTNAVYFKVKQSRPCHQPSTGAQICLY